MAELFHKTFATDLSEFDATSASSGTVEQSAGAGLNGTTGGVLYTISAGTAAIYGAINQSLSGMSVYRTAWYTDLSSYAIGTAGQLVNFWLPRAGAGNGIGALRLRNVAGAFSIGLLPITDSGVKTEVIVPFDGLPAGIEIRTLSETIDTAADGVMQLYLVGGDYSTDGEMVAEATALDNVEIFQATSGFRVGPQATGGINSQSGTILFDEWVSRNDDTPILFGVSEASSYAYANILSHSLGLHF